MAAKTDVVVKLILVFFLSLLSFSIGTFVGKKYSDNQHQLSQLEPQKGEKPEREVASVQEGSEKKSGAMSDEEIAKLAEEFVADDAKPATETAKEEGENKGTKDEAHGEATATATAESHKPAEAHKPAAEAHGKEKSAVATKHDEPSTAAKDLASGKHPVATAPEHSAAATAHETRVPSSLPKDVAQYTVGKFTVQVASYTDENEAQKMASDLKEKGYSAFYIPANIKGKTWFRVSVGQFATPKEAATYRAELLSKAKVSSAMVQKITE